MNPPDTEPAHSAGQKPAAPRRWEAAGLFLLLAYFGARLLYLALRIDPFVPPDEVTHFGRVGIFSAVAWLPSDGPDTFAFGLIAHRPPLYYFLMGKLVLLAPSGTELVTLRLCNGALAVATAVFGIAWIRLVSESTTTRLLFTAILTNVLMFTGLGAAVNYDNLVNLFAAGAIYFLYRLHREQHPGALLCLGLCVLGGCLTKLSFLPLAAILFVLLVLREGPRASVWMLKIGGEMRSRKAGPWFAVVAIAALLTANVALYAGNWMNFGKLTPDFDQIVSFEDALQYRIFARQNVLESYREGRVSYPVAMQMTKIISHAGDRRSTKALLKTTRNMGKRRVGLARYTEVWMKLMFQRSIGYFGHRVLTRSPQDGFAYFSFIGLAALLLAIRGGARLPRGDLLTMLGLAAGYVLVVFWLLGRWIYLDTGLIDDWVQGRYLFPALVPLCGLLAIPIGQLLPRLLQAPVAAAIALYFIYGDLPYLLLNVPPDWFITQ